MPLEDSSSVDMVGKTQDGRLGLYITDSGQTSNDVERLEKLKNKIECYGHYIADKVATDYQEYGANNIEIIVLCKNPPTKEMLRVDSVSISMKTTSESETYEIPVVFKLFPGVSC